MHLKNWPVGSGRWSIGSFQPFIGAICLFNSDFYPLFESKLHAATQSHPTGISQSLTYVFQNHTWFTGFFFAPPPPNRSQRYF